METTTLLLLTGGFGEEPDVADGIPIGSRGYGGVLATISDSGSCSFIDPELTADISNIVHGSLSVYINGYLVDVDDPNVVDYQVSENAGINGATIVVELANWHNTRVRNILKNSVAPFMAQQPLEDNVRVSVVVQGYTTSGSPRESLCYFDLPRAVL